MAQSASAAITEADAAASDAAIEARREALDSVVEAKKVAAPAAATARTGKKVKPEWHRFDIDVWLTDFNAVEFGIYRHSRNRAKSRQFTTDMDIYAEVKENGERTGLIGYREDLWKKKSGTDKRLVFKLFNETLNWRATMDLMLARSIQQTLGARGLPVMTFSLNTGDHEQVIYIERSANKWPLMPENFSFFLMDDGNVEFFRIRQDLIRFGQDYTVLNERNEKIGYLDGAVFTLGGYWKCKVRSDYKDKRLHTVMKMFAGMLCFNKGCRRHIDRLADGVRRGAVKPTLERQETDLYMNPRRVR